MTFEKGWLEREYSKIKAETEQWPTWMKESRGGRFNDGSQQAPSSPTNETHVVRTSKATAGGSSGKPKR